MSGEVAAPGAWPAKAAAGNIKAAVDVTTMVQANRLLLKAE
jgi:hypothetical protein